MKKQQGFNLVELMVAIALSTVVILAMSTSFSSLYNGYIFNNNKVALQRDLRFALTEITSDLQNAGVFGSISFHDESAGPVYSTVGSCTSDWCQYDTTSVGVRSFASGSTITGSGITSTSEILRVQGGGDKTAYYSSSTYTIGSIHTNWAFSQLNFSVPSGNSTSAITYMLASSNRVYLINLGSATSNSSLSNINLGIESFTNSKFYDPDQTSMTLVPFITKYYFVNSNSNNSYGKAGLYMVSYNGSTLSSAALLSDQVTDLTIQYTVAVNPSGVNRTGGSSYAVCTTSQMISGNANCSGKWSQIVAVTVSLTGQSQNLVSSSGSALTQLESDTVGWLW